MNKTGKTILIPVLLIVLTFIFAVLDSGLGGYQVKQLVQPVIFAFSVVACILSAKLRRYLIIFALFLLILMVITYLFNALSVSNWLGSLGFGMLFISVFSYMPQFVKKGHLEKF